MPDKNTIKKLEDVAEALEPMPEAAKYGVLCFANGVLLSEQTRAAAEKKAKEGQGA